jgi:hypothetical protein
MQSLRTDDRIIEKLSEVSAVLLDSLDLQTASTAELECAYLLLESIQACVMDWAAQASIQYGEVTQQFSGAGGSLPNQGTST